MKLNKSIDFPLKNAGASIRYRVKKEILKIPVDCDDMVQSQGKILTLPKVKKVFACQKDSGFFGSVIHGVYFDGFDSTLGLLKDSA